VRFPIFSILIILFIAAPVAGGEEFIEREATYWYEMWFLGKRVGYMTDHVNLVRLDGREVWKIYREETHFRKGPAGLIKFSAVYVDYVTRDFSLIRALQAEFDADQVKTTSIEVTGNTALVTVSLEGRSTSFSVPVVPGTVTATSGFQLWKSDLLRENTTLRIPVLVPEERKVFKEVIRIGTSECVAFGNSTYRMFNSRTSRADLAGLEDETIYGEDGTEILLKMGGMELRSSTREAALTQLPDGFDDIDVSIKVDAQRDDYLKADDFVEFVFEVTVEGIDNASALFEPHPGSEFINDSFVRLSEVMPIIEGDIIPDEVRVFLEPSLTVQSDDPEIVETVRRILGGEAHSPVETAVRLMNWVCRSMRFDRGGPASKTALAALRELGGDCSEYAVLFTALCRASGVPARSVIGLLLENGEMTYHQWAEIYTDGRWILCDPTRPMHPDLAVLPKYLAICLDREDRAGTNPIYRQTALQGLTTVRLVSGVTMDGNVIDFTKPRKSKYPPRLALRKGKYGPPPKLKENIYPPFTTIKKGFYPPYTGPEVYRHAPIIETEQRSYPRHPIPMLPSHRVKRVEDQEKENKGIRE